MDRLVPYEGYGNAPTRTGPHTQTTAETGGGAGYPGATMAPAHRQTGHPYFGIGRGDTRTLPSSHQ